MKKNLLIIILTVFLTGLNANAISLKGLYEGVGKVKGQPVDCWTTMELDGEDAEIVCGGYLNVMGEYTATGSGNNITLTVSLPGNPKVILKSTDGGESFTGKLTINKLEIELWLLKVAKKHKPTEMSNEELGAIVNSEDGYNCFMICESSHMLICVTCDFNFSKDGKFALQCDNSSMQQLLNNFKGTYTIEDGKVIMKTTKGITLTGTIYDKGCYIDIPIGMSESGVEMKSLILIR